MPQKRSRDLSGFANRDLPGYFQVGVFLDKKKLLTVCGHRRSNIRHHGGQFMIRSILTLICGCMLLVARTAAQTNPALDDSIC